MWYHYYSKHFDDADIYILDDGSDDGYLDGIGGNIEQVGEQGWGYRGDTRLRVTVNDRFIYLLNKYEYVLVADTDEFIVPDPEQYPDGLKQYVDEFQDVFAQCSGYNIVDSTGVPLDVNDPWLAQREHWHRDWQHYCKVVMANRNPKWGGGRHNSRWTRQNVKEIGEHERENLRLLHFHYICKELTRRRWSVRHVPGDRLFKESEAYQLTASYVDREGHITEPIPEKWKSAL